MSLGYANSKHRTWMNIEETKMLKIWDCKTVQVQTLGKTEWQYLQKIGTEFSYDLAILVLHI